MSNDPDSSPNGRGASFIHIMAKNHLVLVLSELVSYDFLGFQDGYLGPDDDLLWKGLDVDRRIECAAALVCQWSCDGGWPESKEGIRETLAGFLDMNRYFLPSIFYMGSL